MGKEADLVKGGGEYISDELWVLDTEAAGTARGAVRWEQLETRGYRPPPLTGHGLWRGGALWAGGASARPGSRCLDGALEVTGFECRRARGNSMVNVLEARPLPRPPAPPAPVANLRRFASGV